MADEDVSDYVEGFNAAGKNLERITDTKQLVELHKETNSQKNKVDNDLAQEQQELQKLQNSLNKENEDYIRKQMTLEGLKRKQQVSLQPSQKAELSSSINGTLDRYLERRPWQPDEKRTVHVYFLSGEECGSALHIGQEGAGSRDATFTVSLNQTVQSLATQAAKYWGLNAEKVFFLDRDGRIVQGKMCLSDIILPPLDPSARPPPGAGGSGSTALVPAGGASSSQAIVPQGEAQPEAFTVKGRAYSLTLVRAKTVLAKEDLSQPKGEQWKDFTFDKKQLEDDLDQTRKKRGDPEHIQEKIGMENIPSLYDLIRAGNLRKNQKLADKYCRICEMIIFAIMWAAFVTLLKPNSSWSLRMNAAAALIQHDLTTFTVSEQGHVGVTNYTEIARRSEFDGWIGGPLKRAVLPGGLDKKNLFVMKVQGRVFKSNKNQDLGLNFCAGPPSTTTIAPTTTGPTTLTTTTTTTSTTTSTSTTTTTTTSTTTTATMTPTTTTTTTATTLPAKCYPPELAECPSKGVVNILTYAIDQGQTGLTCKAMYDKDPFINTVRAFMSVDAFSYITGQTASYIGGDPTTFGLTSQANYDASVTQFKAGHNFQPPAKLINVMVWAPSLEGIFVFQFLTEFTVSGPLITNVERRAIALDGGDTWEVVVFFLCIVLAIVCLLLELRRITGFPQRCFFEGKRDNCGMWTFVFLVLPILLLVALSLLLKRMNSQFDVLALRDTSTLASTAGFTSVFPHQFVKAEPYSWTRAERALYQLRTLLILDKTKMVCMLVNFSLMMFLSVRYFLMFFPEMSYITVMLQRIVKPLAVTLLILIMAFACFGSLFYCIFSDHMYEFRNIIATLMSTLQFAHGGFMHWADMYNDYKWTWTLLMLCSFAIFTLNLNHFAIAILVSHKKEAELRRNYSSHPFWQVVNRDHPGDTGELNPALVGWDFGDPPYKDGEAKQVKERPGLRV